MVPSIDDGAWNTGQRSPQRSRRSSLTQDPATSPDFVRDISSQAYNNGRHGQAPSLEVRGASHLPSPSPSPRSRSPSSAIGDNPREHLVSTTSHHGRKDSGSFEHSNIRFGNLEDNEDGSIMSSPPPPISKTLQLNDLHVIPEEKVKKTRKPSTSKAPSEVLKLTAAEVQELTSAPESLPVTSPSRAAVSAITSLAPSPVFEERPSNHGISKIDSEDGRSDSKNRSRTESLRGPASGPMIETKPASDASANTVRERPRFASRTSSNQTNLRTPSYVKSNQQRQSSPRRKPLSTNIEPLDLNHTSNKDPLGKSSLHQDNPPSPIPQSIPLPPMSIPTYLQLELSSSRPSPLYIYRSQASEKQYESSRVKFERLLNFLLLPPQLEQVLCFGSLACLDAWLYTFTILPLRFFKALVVLARWWALLIIREFHYISGFIYHGSGRMWDRQRGRGESIDSASRSRSVSRAARPALSTTNSYQTPIHSSDAPNGSSISEHLKSTSERKSGAGWRRRHKRSKSQPSSLSSYHKADILQGAVIICSCIILLKLDASRMYHGIRGQSAIKLYVIYNLLEVCDRLFSAIGQDIFECLFSDEILERDAHGRSKILRPLGMFVLALIYNVIHATALFYQVIALNVAVNSYSNALITLLMSNQFVEIKSTVFKKFEKDNLFQLTCADVVERFQLWLMLIIIALRNIVEVGASNALSEAAGEAVKDSATTMKSNTFLPDGFAGFSILPSWAGEVLTPFLFVLGSEMGVDWIKHAYISKFNGVKPALYQKFLDVLAKDYYTNAFVNQNLVKRLGLPVIPLSCLFIRSSVQTYHMFLATRVSPPIPSATTSLSVESSPATTAALEHFDQIIRGALGRSAFGIPDPYASARWYLPSADNAIAALTMLVFFLGAYLVLLALKLVLGMVLLRFARNRYRDMKRREHANYDTNGKRVGGWGMVEVDDDKRRWIYDDDPDALKRMKDKERVAKEKAEKGATAAADFSRISRYEMSAKRIW